jgi:hypothetical protein
MAEYGEGYTEPAEGLSADGSTEERPNVGGSKRGSKGKVNTCLSFTSQNFLLSYIFVI